MKLIFLSEMQRIWKYIVVGIATTSVLYMLYLILVYTKVPPVLSSTICYAIGVALSYIFNRRWTFNSKSMHQKDLPRFLFAYGVGFAVTILTILTSIEHVGPEVAQIIAIALTPIAIFITLRFIKFGN